MTTRLVEAVDGQLLDGRSEIGGRTTRVVDLPDLDPSLQNLSGNKLLELAHYVIEDNDPVRAYRFCKHAMTRDCTPQLAWETLSKIGSVWLSSGDHVQAILAFEEAKKLQPRLVNSHFNMAVAYHQAGKYQQALFEYETAHAVEPDNAQVYSGMSAVYFEMEEYAQAEKHALEALRQEEGYISAWDNLAAALAAQGKMHQAEVACWRGLKHRPDSARLWFKLGVLLYDQNRDEEALQSFLRAQAFDAASDYVTAYICMLTIRNGDLKTAQEHLERITESQPCEVIWLAWNELILAFLSENELERAAYAGRQAVRTGPDHFEAWFNLGLAYQRAEMWTDALDSYECALSRKNDSVPVLHNLGVVYSETENYKRAVECFGKVVLAEPENATAYYDLSVSLKRAGRAKEAMEARDEALCLSNRQRGAEGNVGERGSLWNKIAGVFN